MPDPTAARPATTCTARAARNTITVPRSRVGNLRIGSESSIPTYEAGGAGPQGAPGRAAAGHAGRCPAARVRGEGSAAGGQRRPVRPAHRYRLSGPAPTGGGRADQRSLVGRRRPAPALLPADPGRAAQAGRGPGQLAGV